MADFIMRTTRSGTKRILLEHDDANHAKKRLLLKDQALTKLLSKEEQKLFHFDHWYRPKIRNSAIKALAKKFHTYPVPFVRKAYHSVRQTRSEDISEVLKDNVTMRALFPFVACLRRMKEYPLCMKAIRTDLSRKVQLDGTTAFVPFQEAGPSANPEELDRSKKGKCRSCSLIHARVSLLPSGNGNAFPCTPVLIEGYGHAELTGMVQDRVSVLKVEMEKEEASLIELINSVYKSECVSASDLLRSKLTSSLRTNIHGSVECMSSNKEIYTAFKKLVELMDSIWHTWHTDKNEWPWPSREAFEEWKKSIRSSEIFSSSARS